MKWSYAGQVPDSKDLTGFWPTVVHWAHTMDEFRERETVLKLQAYAALIRAGQKIQNLLSAKDCERLESRHINDCLKLLEFASFPKNGSVIDVGSGSGLPGMVIAISRPELRITCVESERRKCDFLRSAVERLGLTNVTVMTARAEQLGHDTNYREGFAAATARACAPWPLAAELCSAFVSPGGGVFLFGSPAQQQQAVTARTLAELGLRPSKHLAYGLVDPLVQYTIQAFIKEKNLEKKFPRPWKQMLKKAC